MAWRWPPRLWIVRHGESAGNIAFDAAHASGAPRIDIKKRNPAVRLSELGKQQTSALGAFSRLPTDHRPQTILTSPYIRAQQTAEFFICAEVRLTIAQHRAATSGFASGNSGSSKA
jgi:probable phosphoglycerate mutase